MVSHPSYDRSCDKDRPKTYIDVAQLGVLPHRANKSPRHGTRRRARNRRVRRCLVVATPRKHPDILALPFPVLREVLGGQPVLVCAFAHVVQAVEEVRRTTQEHLGVGHLFAAPSALDQLMCGTNQAGPFLQLVHQIDVAFGIGPVDVWEFAGRARVTAVEEDRKSCFGVHGADDCSVKLAAVTDVSGLLMGIG